jgi:hypothetical protein
VFTAQAATVFIVFVCDEADHLSSSHGSHEHSNGSCSSYDGLIATSLANAPHLIWPYCAGGTPTNLVHHQLLPRPQPANIVAHIKPVRVGLIKPLDLLHDEVGFGGLGVGDVDGEMFVVGDMV